MEINVKVTVELGDKTISLLSDVLAPNQSGNEARPKIGYCIPSTFKTEADQYNEATAAAPAEKPARTRRTKEQIAADAAKPAPAKESVKVEVPEPEEEAAPDFATLSDEEKVSALREKVATYTKKGKSADIRFMLAQFDARTVSKGEPLKPEDYDAFYEILESYGAGKSVTDIFPELN